MVAYTTTPLGATKYPVAEDTRARVGDFAKDRLETATAIRKIEVVCLVVSLELVDWNLDSVVGRTKIVYASANDER